VRTRPVLRLGAALGVVGCAAIPAWAQTSSGTIVNGKITNGKIANAKIANAKIANAKIDSALQASLQSGAPTQHVIISVRPGYRASVRETLLSHGDLIKSDHPPIDALSAEIHSTDVAELARQPWIEGVSIDATVYAVGGNRSKGNSGKRETAASRLRETLGLSAVGTTGAGQGVVVAVIDSGIATSSDLPAPRITQFYDFTLPGCAAAPMSCRVTPFDDFGHGTHVAGLIGGSGQLSNNLYQGVAPGVKFVGVKVLDKTGVGTTSDVINAITFVVANRALFGVQIINLSLGHPIFAPAAFDPLVRAVEQASAAGITVVIAAGNNPGNRTGYAGIMSPGNSPSAITSGAVDTKWTTTRDDDVVADYSARGPTWFDAFAKPDVVAPGSRLISDATVDSTLFNDPSLITDRVAVGNSWFLQLSGTSMAAAVTSGVVALVVEASSAHVGDPPLTPNSVKAIVEYTAIPISRADFLTAGAGQINAAGAVALASRINTDAKLGDWWLTSGIDPFSTIGNQSYRWAQEIIWGATELGGDLVYRNLMIWSRNIIWGTNIIRGTNTSIAWGATKNILWTVAGDPNTIQGTFTNTLWGAHVGGAPNLVILGGDLAKLTDIIWGSSTVVKQSNVWSTDIHWGTDLVDVTRVVARQDGDNILWGTGDGGNVVWATLGGDNIVWGSYEGDSVLWGTWSGDDIVWGTTETNGDNIAWGTWDAHNIIWGAYDGENIIWSSPDSNHIVWGTSDGDHIVWGTAVLPGDAF
jgi:serine protease AprX